MDRSGSSLVEIVMVLVILAAMAPPLIGSAAELRRSFLLNRAREEAARLFTEARWTSVSEGGATVILNADPPWGAVVTAGNDTTRVTALGTGGVSLRLSRGRASSRVRFGPLGLGLVSSQTLTFELDEAERRLVISSLGRVSRR